MATSTFIPDLKVVSQQYKLRLKALDSQIMSDLARQYRNVYATADAELASLTAKMSVRELVGLPPVVGQVFRQDRLKQLMDQVQRQLEAFSKAATERLAGAQTVAMQEATKFAQDAAQAAMGTPPAGSRFSTFWSQLGQQAMINIVANTAPGGPVHSVLQSLAPQGVSEARQIIANGAAQGYNPREIAAQLHSQLGAPLARAQTIARTEIMRAGRDVLSQSYQANSDVVQGWLWSAALDDRTCEECWALDGTWYEVQVEAYAHINCRCTMEPDLRSYSAMGFGEEGMPQFDESLDPNAISGELYNAGASIDYGTGTVTAYHYTSEAARNQIERTGKMSSRENGIFFTTSPHSDYGKGFGDVQVRVQLPISKVELNDIFPGKEAHLRLGDARVTDVSQYLTSGPAKFAQLSDARQLRILGPAKYRAYKAEVVHLRDFIGYKDSPIWGRSTYAKSLKEILGAKKAKTFYGVSGSQRFKGQHYGRQAT